MTLQYYSLSRICVAFLALAVAGCGSNSADSPIVSKALETAAPPATVGTGHAHAHPREGPHRGSLIELGNEEYHAELVHDDAAGIVTVYLLDSNAKSSVPIDARAVMINLTHDGHGKQFTLLAAPISVDPPNTSSAFKSADAELARLLDQDGTNPQIAVDIGGQSLRGSISRSHDHEEHNH